MKAVWPHFWVCVFEVWPAPGARRGHQNCQAGVTTDPCANWSRTGLFKFWATPAVPRTCLPAESRRCPAGDVSPGAHATFVSHVVSSSTDHVLARRLRIAPRDLPPHSRKRRTRARRRTKRRTRARRRRTKRRCRIQPSAAVESNQALNQTPFRTARSRTSCCSC